MNSLGVFAIGLAAFVVMSAPAKGGPQPTQPPSAPPGTLPQNMEENCGNPAIQPSQGTSRVINGQTAVPNSWPWQILMSYGGRAGCGGTLISSRWVVTAALCVYRRENSPHKFTVRVGEHDRDRKEGPEVDYQVEKVVRHPQYNPRAINNDIALFKLAKPVMFNSKVSPACLPDADIPVGTECYVTGWGKMKHPGKMVRYLQQARLVIHDTAACEQSLLDNPRIPNLYQHTTMLCAGGQGSSGCHGDSGGPLVCKQNGTWALAGAVSFGDSKCDVKFDTNFARIAHFKQWILQKIG